MTLRLAVVGDIHGQWTPADNGWFDRSGVDLVVVVGDLAGLRWSGTLAVAQALGALRVPTLVVPGNHDGTHPLQLGAEVAGLPALGGPLAASQAARVDALAQAVSPHPLAAYSAHPLGAGPEALTLIAGRPHPMGGPHISFATYMQARWGVHSMADSTARLVALVDQAPTKRLVFIAHNGPAGLGEGRADPWGRDFDPREGDWGDPDLAAAIAHARATGRRVLAVVAGHMHRRLRGGGARTWRAERDGTLYINAAEVPRIRGGLHHHVELRIGPDGATAEDRWVDPARGTA